MANTLRQAKKRHGCLTAWLTLMLIANSATVMMLVFEDDVIASVYPEAPSWMMPLMALLNFSCVVWAMALMKWKRWGFWGFCVTNVVSVPLNMALGFGVGQSLVGLAGLGILFGLLNVGGDRNAWCQLE